MSGVDFFPQILQPGQVIGRLALDPGPAEAIPLAVLFAAMTTGTARQITGATDTATPTDQVLYTNKPSPASTTIQLGSVYLRKGVALQYYDFGGNAGPITFLPFAGETINGLTSWTIASGKSLTLVPITGIPGWVASSAAVSGGSGSATLDFGAFPGAADISLAITGQANIVTGSVVDAWISATATADHTADEHWVDPPYITAGNIVAGTGFTIYGKTPQAFGRDTQVSGKWTVNWQWT